MSEYTLINGVIHELGCRSGDIERWDAITIERLNQRTQDLRDEVERLRGAINEIRDDAERRMRIRAERVTELEEAMKQVRRMSRDREAIAQTLFRIHGVARQALSPTSTQGDGDECACDDAEGDVAERLGAWRDDYPGWVCKACGAMISKERALAPRPVEDKPQESEAETFEPKNLPAAARREFDGETWVRASDYALALSEIKRQNGFIDEWILTPSPLPEEGDTETSRSLVETPEPGGGTSPLEWDLRCGAHISLARVAPNHPSLKDTSPPSVDAGEEPYWGSHKHVRDLENQVSHLEATIEGMAEAVEKHRLIYVQGYGFALYSRDEGSGGRALHLTDDGPPNESVLALLAAFRHPRETLRSLSTQEPQENTDEPE